MDAAIQYQGLWEQFSWVMLELSMLWAICAAVLLFWRSFALTLTLVLLGSALLLLCIAPISPASWGVLITAFVVHAYERMSRLVRTPLVQAKARVEDHDRHS